MEDLNPRLRLRRPKGYPDYPNRPASYWKGYGYITLSLSSRAKTILIMSYISKETLGVAGLVFIVWAYLEPGTTKTAIKNIIIPTLIIYMVWEALTKGVRYMQLGKAGLAAEYSRKDRAITHNNPTLRQMRRNRMNKIRQEGLK